MYGNCEEVENVPVFQIVSWQGDDRDRRNIHLYNELRHMNCGGKVASMRGRMEGSKIVYDGCSDDTYKARCEKCGKEFCIGLD